MTLAEQLKELAAKAEHSGATLRFSQCEAGFRWSSVQTNSIARLHLLNFLWNNLPAIIAELESTVGLHLYDLGKGDRLP